MGWGSQGEVGQWVTHSTGFLESCGGSKACWETGGAHSCPRVRADELGDVLICSSCPAQTAALTHPYLKQTIQEPDRDEEQDRGDLE